MLFDLFTVESQLEWWCRILKWQGKQTTTSSMTTTDMTKWTATKINNFLSVVDRMTCVWCPTAEQARIITSSPLRLCSTWGMDAVLDSWRWQNGTARPRCGEPCRISHSSETIYYVRHSQGRLTVHFYCLHLYFTKQPNCSHLSYFVSTDGHIHITHYQTNLHISQCSLSGTDF